MPLVATLQPPAPACGRGAERRALTVGQRAALADVDALIEDGLASLRWPSIDPHTGVCGPGGFAWLGGRVLDACRLGGLPVSALVLEAVGASDGELFWLARIAEATLRSSDLVGRIGDDRFAALLTATSRPGPAISDLAGAVAAMNERARRGGRPPVAVRTGAACAGATADLDDLVRRAVATLC